MLIKIIKVVPRDGTVGGPFGSYTMRSWVQAQHPAASCFLISNDMYQGTVLGKKSLSIQIEVKYRLEQWEVSVPERA